MLVYISCDHAGFELKEKVKSFLLLHDYEVKDFGPEKFVATDDYPEYIQKAMKEFIKSDLENTKCIVLGGSGTGEAIVANRFDGVRAVVFNHDNLEIVKLGREHNDANVLSIGARFVDLDLVKQAIQIFFNTKFDKDSRYGKRVLQIDAK